MLLFVVDKHICIESPKYLYKIKFHKEAYKVAKNKIDIQKSIVFLYTTNKPKTYP